MERLLKNVTETDIINFDFIKRNRVSLKGKNKIITKIFSSRLSYDILHMAYERIDKFINSDFTYIDIINLNPADAIRKFNNNKKHHIFNNPLYRYFNYDKILEYANNHIKIYHTLSKFENGNNIGRNISIFAISSKVFGARYDLEYTLKIQDILLEKILANKNITADELINIINNFVKENKLKNIKVRREPIVSLIKMVNKLPNVYTDLDQFIKKYKDVRHSYKTKFILKETGFKSLSEAGCKLPFFSLRLAVTNENEKRQMV